MRFEEIGRKFPPFRPNEWLLQKGRENDQMRREMRNEKKEKKSKKGKKRKEKRDKKEKNSQRGKNGDAVAKHGEILERERLTSL